MNTLAENPSRLEFSFPLLDTLVSVERAADQLVIRTSRDTLSDVRKAAFVRELASEGFIPDEYRWSFSGNEGMSRRVRWLVDPAWWMPSREVGAVVFRFVARMLGCAVLLWLSLTVMLLCRAAR